MVSGGLGEAETGGPSMNIIPRTGAHVSGVGPSGAGRATGRGARTSTIICAASGFTRGAALITAWASNGSFEGPIRRDGCGSTAASANSMSAQAVEGVFATSTRANTDEVGLSPGRQRRGAELDRGDTYLLPCGAGDAAQPRDLLPGESICAKGLGDDSAQSPAGQRRELDRDGIDHQLFQRRLRIPRLPLFRDAGHVGIADDQPLLLEAASSRFLPLPGNGRFSAIYRPDAILASFPSPNSGGTTAIGANFAYRGALSTATTRQPEQLARRSIAYVTVAHNLSSAIKVHFQRGSDFGGAGGADQNQSQMAYRFDNGVPNQFPYGCLPGDRRPHACRPPCTCRTMDRRPPHAAGRVAIHRASSWSPARAQRNDGRVAVQRGADQLSSGR